MNNTTQRYVELDFARVFFAVVVFLYHSHNLPNVSGIFEWGFLSTDFFFMVAGFFMSDVILNKEISTKKYIYTRFVSIYKYYFPAFMVAFISRQFVFKCGIKKVILNFASSIFELIPVYMGGIKPHYGYNGPDWFVSSMLIGLLVLYPLMKKYKDYMLPCGALLLTILCYAVINQNASSLNVSDVWWHFCYLGTIRAVAGMSFGAALYVLRSKLLNYNIRRWVLDLVEILSMVFVVIVMYCGPTLKLGHYIDYVSIVVLAIIILCITTKRLSNKKYLFKVSKICREFSVILYLSHRCIIFQLVDVGANNTMQQNVIYYIIGTIVSGCLVFALTKINSRLIVIIKKWFLE